MRLVLSKTLVMLLLAAGGVIARRRRLLDEHTCATLSRLVVDVTFPALVLAQLIRTIDRETLAASWPLPLLGDGVLLIGGIFGWLTSGLFCDRPEQRRTYIFACGLPNWIFLPLLIVESLHGKEGVRAVLLLNVGMLLLLWTLGVWLLASAARDEDQPGDKDPRSEGAPTGLAALARNPGLLATVGGAVLAVGLPVLGRWQRQSPATLGPLGFTVHSLFSALGLLGQVTVPMSVFVTGGQLGALPASALRPDRPVVGVLLARLVLTPLLLLGVLSAAHALGLRISPVDEAVTLIVSAMPVAVSSSLFVQRFGGRVELAARAVLLSTLLSTVSVPALYWVYGALGSTVR